MKARSIAALAVLLPLQGQILLNPPKEPSVITVDVDLVNILCTVRDKSGAYVKNLSKADFEVREDGKQQEITHFARDVDTPLSIALMIDVSGSVMRILDVEKDAAKHFFSDLLRPNDQAMLGGFAQLITIWQELTPSVETLQSALEEAGPANLAVDGRRAGPVRGGTLLYDAVKLVAAQKMRRVPGRKIILLITDGLDNGSIASPEEAAKAAQEADTVIYGIHYVDEIGSSRRDGAGALSSMSDPTGGRTFHVDQKMPLEKVFAAISEDMRNQYAIGYKPPSPARDGAYHKLQVKLHKSGLSIASRNGYYAIPR